MSNPTVTFLKPTPDDIPFLAAHMRPEDLRELEDRKLPPLFAMRQSLRLSNLALTARFDDKPAGLFGVRHLDDKTGDLLLIVSNFACKWPRTFLRASHDALAVLKAERPNLFVWTDARKASTLRWAASLGFTVSEPRAKWGGLYCLCSIGDVSTYARR